MELSHGKHTASLDGAGLSARLAGFHDILVDLGTGDGRWVLESARRDPARFAIGIDACRENLRASARRLPPHALLLIADALALPPELAGLATTITINFPWGSLLTALLTGHSGLIEGLRRTAHPGATLELRLNRGALIQAGYGLPDAATLAARTLHDGGFAVAPPVLLDAVSLRACASSWARRLAFGPDPWALYLRATLPSLPSHEPAALSGAAAHARAVAES